MQNENIKIPRGAEIILERLKLRGYDGYIVGGSVRDAIRGLAPSDYDITTDALPEKTQEIFSDMRTIEVGLKHGTLGVMSEGELYEVTTYRIDGDYTDSRHPDSVTFTKNIKDDLSRRDFTMNAIAYNSDVGFVDAFGGIDDIRARVIRAVGCPAKRFSEDALRILRALRFSSTLCFEIESETSRAIFEKAHLLSDISRERIFVEWKKLLSGNDAYRVITDHASVLAFVLPSLDKIKLPSREFFDSGDESVREISLFIKSSTEPAEAYRVAMEYLRADRHRQDVGLKVITHISDSIEDRRDIKRLLSKIGEEATALLLRVRECVCERKEPYGEALEEILTRGEPYSIKHLAVGGEDIKSLGILGREVGEALSYLLELVIDNAELNERSTLISALKEREI